MVWVAITYGSKTELINFDRYIIDNTKGNIDSYTYINYIIPVFYDFWKSIELPEKYCDPD
jgi:hypothetical protein